MNDPSPFAYEESDPALDDAPPPGSDTISGLRPPPRVGVPHARSVPTKQRGPSIPVPVAAKTASPAVLVTVLLLVVAVTGAEMVLSGWRAASENIIALTMLCALFQALLIFGVFMRFVWDRGLHTVMILFALTLALLFVAAGVADRREYHWGYDSVETANL